jgi:cell cycle sensor histidine kinase DivJ
VSPERRDIAVILKQKLLTTLMWAATCIGIAMIADYVVTILLLHNYPGYTPLITLAISTIVSFPVTFILVSSKYDLREARDALAAARDVAVNANLSKTRFFANMSHELRTPLNAVIGFSQLLETDMFAARRTEYARLIRQSGEHLLELVNDLLDISKMESGKFELDETEVDLAGVIAECCTLVEPRLRTMRLRLVQNTGHLPPVIGDRRALKQIVLNLLTNAIKFSRADGTVEILAAVVSAGELAFSVRDNGIGIAPQDQVRIFEPYARTKQEIAQKQEGTGLGLPIVKGLVEAHSGRVCLESALDRGTCITIWLPAYRVCNRQQNAVAS